ncbi:unnamed protein product [Dicrocoelium dendriticum]|nr:unnamed protein product [Dicrocoelium dendriticum]
MLQCWSRFPEMRPSFADLAKKMNEFVKLSQESGSPFSGPFIVTLPLPKSLPDSSGQPMFNCLPNERHFGRELIDPMHNPMHRKCQRQASFNDYGASERMHQARIRQQVSLDENRPSRALNSPDLSACQEQNNSRGCLVSPAARGVHMRPVRAYRNTTTCDLRRAIRFHPASHLTGYEGALSGLSSEQNNFIGGASVATTTAGSTEVTHNGYPTHLTNAEKPHSPNWNSNGMAFKMTALSGDGATARPLSLLENSAKSSLKEPTWEMQPMFYRTFNRPIHSAKPSSLDSAMRPHMNVTMPIRNPTTINNNEVPCWLTETGGGVDSLGYERPSWTSQMVTMRNPAMHWSQTQQFSQALAHSINRSAVAAAGNFSG